MVCCRDVCPPPSFKIKHIHSIKPSTMIMIKIWRYYRVWEIQVILVFSSWATVVPTWWANNSTNNFPIEIQFQQGWQVMLYYYIIVQKQYLVQIWKQLWGSGESVDKSIIITNIKVSIIHLNREGDCHKVLDAYLGNINSEMIHKR